MAEEQQGLMEQLVEAMGLDPNETQEVDVISALNETIEDLKAAKSEKGLTDEYDKEIVANLDGPAIAAGIQQRAEEIRHARLATPQQLATGRKVRENPDEAVPDAAKQTADALSVMMKQVAPHSTDNEKELIAPRQTSIGVVFRSMADKRQGMSLLMTHPTPNPVIRECQRACDDLMLLGAYMGVGLEDGPIQGLTDLDRYQEWNTIVMAHAKAIDTTEHSTWTPTVYSPDFIENVYQSTDIARLFPRMDWPGPGGTMTIPAEGSDITIYGAAEATTDDSDPPFTASDPGVGTNITVTAKTLTGRTVVSWEMIEDSIVPILEHIRAKHVRQMARGLDDAIISGDTAGTHQDTDVNALAANDHRKQWDGLRKAAIANTTTATDMSTNYNYETVMTPILLMGAYGQTTSSDEVRASDTVLMASHPWVTKLGWLRDTNDNNLYLAWENIGSPGASVTGRIPSIGGFQIVPSAMMRSDLNQADGVNGASANTFSAAMFVYIPGWLIADKRLLQIGMIDRLEYGQKVMVSHQRTSFTNTYASSENSIGHLYGFDDNAA